MNFNVSGSGFEDLAGVIAFVSIVIAIVSIVVHVFFANAVFRDACDLMDSNTGPAFVPASVWGIATLVGGVLVAGLYWAMHHSTLRRASDEPE